MNYTPLAMTTVLVAVGTGEASRFVRQQQHEKVGSAMSPVIGGFVLGLCLFAIGMMSEDIGTKLCVLIMVASLVMHGLPLISLLK